MTLINWGSESPDQLAIRRRLEEQALYEQAVRMAQARNRAGNAVGCGSKPNILVGSVDWLDVAPGGGSGTDPEDFDYGDFDNWTTAEFFISPSLTDIRRLVLSSGAANAHVHEDLPYSNLTIDLYDASASSWVTVWSYTLPNPNYPEDGSGDYLLNGIDVVFPAIGEVTRIRLTSDPGSDQTYHDWDQDSSNFNFYR
jgi:hypothetical protein